MLNWLMNLVYWWLILFCLGWLVWPLTKKLFAGFFDQGYLFSKTLAIVITSYLAFLMAHLKIIPLTYWGIIINIIISGLIIFLIWGKKSFWPQNPKIIIIEEIVFFICLLSWAYVRSLNPDINGLEKFMDFGFLKTLTNARFLPVDDMWFAGESINYYYYGHFMAAFLTKLSRIEATSTYNLMIATIFAQTVTGVFSLTANLTSQITKNKKTIIAAGLITALVIGLGSNLHTVYRLFKDGGWESAYWYPDATRFIGYDPPTDDKTIHEFPAYSFIVADLHGHLSSLPLVLLFMSLSFSLIKDKKNSWLKTGLLGGLLGVIYMTNAWDLPIYLLFTGLLLLINSWSGLPSKAKKVEIIKRVKIILLVLAVIISGALIISLPFNLSFQQMTGGIGLTHTKTPLWQLLILWGALLWWAINFLIFFSRRQKKPITDQFVLGLIVTALILILLPEFVYVKDIYAADYYRANTMFKFTFQAYIMLTITIGYIIARVSQNQKVIWRALFLAISFLIVVCLLVYPFYSLPGFYGSLKVSNFRGLSGINFLAQKYPEDYQGIIWIEKNTPVEAVVLEAAGDSYTDYNRVSTFTGRATIQGWLVHEWLWRGGYQLPAQRAEQVKLVYQSASQQEAKAILNDYGVDYIFLGQLEREKYPLTGESRLSSLGEIVFRAGETLIFKVNNE